MNEVLATYLKTWNCLNITLNIEEKELQSAKMLYFRKLWVNINTFLLPLSKNNCIDYINVIFWNFVADISQNFCYNFIFYPVKMKTRKVQNKCLFIFRKERIETFQIFAIHEPTVGEKNKNLVNKINLHNFNCFF